MSCAVELSFSSTVTSISDPLCTVLAANLEGKGKIKKKKEKITEDLKVKTANTSFCES